MVRDMVTIKIAVKLQVRYELSIYIYIWTWHVLKVKMMHILDCEYLKNDDMVKITIAIKYQVIGIFTFDLDPFNRSRS